MTANAFHDQLKRLPGVDSLLETMRHDTTFSAIPDSVRKTAIRQILDTLRKQILDGACEAPPGEIILARILERARAIMAPRLVQVINATGVVLHTNLGRAPLCEGALENIRNIGAGYSNLELNISTGKRGIRYAAVENLICELTGAEAAMAVNNNAGAVLLCLDTLARGREVIVSRGELVEIGGSFRIPDVMLKSGGILKEVGTTNRTHPRDYQGAISEKTGLLLKVHTSNYRIEGFTASVSLAELVSIGKEASIPVMEDLGSGSLIDLSRYGLSKEPTVLDAVQTGADIVTFSGDKLLGGPQAGIIVGKAEAIAAIRKNPLTRALRIDKLTLAALEPTLGLYRDEAMAVESIPGLRMLTESLESITQRSDRMLALLQETLGNLAALSQADLSSRTGGGAYPELSLPSRCITIAPHTISAARLEQKLRLGTPSIIGRIENDRYIIDPRTIQPGEDLTIAHALQHILSRTDQ
ncbi:MAG: L-seryl-tRNA(Sec) selenium transferase [Pseudomonadota bacterium]